MLDQQKLAQLSQVADDRATLAVAAMRTIIETGQPPTRRTRERFAQLDRCHEEITRQLLEEVKADCPLQ